MCEKGRNTIYNGNDHGLKLLDGYVVAYYRKVLHGNYHCLIALFEAEINLCQWPMAVSFIGGGATCWHFVFMTSLKWTAAFSYSYFDQDNVVNVDCLNGAPPS